MNTHEWLTKYKLQDKLPEWWTRVEGYGCHIACPMKDILTWKLVWRQDRYCDPKPWELKSRTRKWSKVGWFYDIIDITRPVILCEGEKDWLTAWQLWWNICWMQWVSNVNKTVDTLIKYWVKTIILLVDNDEAATRCIKKIQNRIPVYDWRYALHWEKDTNDAWLAWVLEEPQVKASENLFVKYWPFKIERSHRPLPDKSIDFLNIDTAMILQNLYPQYTIKGDRIYDNWKLLDGYRYWKTKNAIVDFSGKERPQWNARSIAFSYYKDKKATADYLKRYV